MIVLGIAVLVLVLGILVRPDRWARSGVATFSVGTVVPSSCASYGTFFFNSANPVGRQLYYCNGATFEQFLGDTSMPPAATTLIAPTNGATAVPISPQLQWSASAGATSYDIQLGTTSPPPFSMSVQSTSIAPNLIANTKYYWNVIARNVAGSSAKSATWSFTTATVLAGSVMVYTSPSCNPARSYAAGSPIGATWACGSYPTTTVPQIQAAGCPASTSSKNACTAGYAAKMKDPDTQNRILRLTTTGSLNSTLGGTQWYPYASGWIKVFNSNSTRVLVLGDQNRSYWIGFNPTNMTLTGGSGLLPMAAKNWQFSSTDPDLAYGLQGTNLVSYRISTGVTTTIVNFSSIPGYVAGQNWYALYVGGPTACAFSTAASQGTGRLVACRNTVTNANYMIDLGQDSATLNGTPITNVNVGNVNTLHTILPGQDGRFVFIDTGKVLGAACNTTTPPRNAQFTVDLEIGQGSQLSWYCDQTHLAVGADGVIYQSAGSMTACSSACPYSSLGHSYRTFTLPNPPILVSGCMPSGNLSTHLSWANNFNDANVNFYPVLADLTNLTAGGAGNCLGCGELLAFQSRRTPQSAVIYRFGQTWKTGSQGDYVMRSSQISTDGKWGLFASDWRNTAGAPGHRDFFIMELR
jgi:hypothetical protein